MRLFRRFCLIFILSISLPLQAASIPTFSHIYSFGDSLSDSGNMAQLALSGFVPVTTPPYTQFVPDGPYASGRFSNGPVWVERLAATLGLGADTFPSLLGGKSYAYGGARVGVDGGGLPPSVVSQVAMFTGTHSSADASALYVVWGGGNDLRDAADAAAAALAGGGTAADAAAAATPIISNAITSLTNSITSLAGLGATRFLVPNMPDLGLVPALIVQGAAAQAGASDLSGLFNLGLSGALNGLETALPISIARLDIFQLLHDIDANPAAFGLSNTTDGCALANAGAGCANPADYMFWDGIHPTTAGHAIIADAALNSLSSVPLPASIWLLASGLLLIGARRRLS